MSDLTPLSAVLWGIAASIVVFVVLLPFYVYVGALMAAHVRNQVILHKAAAESRKTQ